MAYQFTDTFDHYNSAMLQAEDMWEYVNNGPPVISSAYARFPAVGSYPNQGVYVPANCSMRKNLKTNQGSLIAFISFGAASLSAGNAPGGTVFAFLYNGTYLLIIALSQSGQLFFYNPDTDTVLAISAIGLIAPASLPNHGIEVAVTLSPTAGTVQMWLDGAVVIPLTSGLNTTHGGNLYANQFALGEGSDGGATFFTDYVRVWDNTGSYQNAPVGYDVRKLTKLPQGPGDLTQWTKNGGASNWQCVDNNPPNPSDYVSSTASGTDDSYSMGSSGLTGIPSQTVVKSYVEKDDANTRAIEIGVRSSGSNGLGSPYTLGTSYVWVDTCISVDPATGSPPTAAAADAFQHLKEEST